MAALALASMVAGCSAYERPEASPLMQAASVVAKTTFKGKGKGKGAEGQAAAAGSQTAVTRADLEKLGVPVMQVAVGARSYAAVLTPSDVKGNIVTWSSQDGKTFTFRDGILIQTRGLGPDLMSASAPTVAQLLTTGATHRREYYFLGDNDQPTRRAYDCTSEIVGKEALEFLERTYTVTHVVETCSRPQGSMKNEYWIDGSIVRRANELLSGGAGYLDVVRIID